MKGYKVSQRLLEMNFMKDKSSNNKINGNDYYKDQNWEIEPGLGEICDDIAGFDAKKKSKDVIKKIMTNSRVRKSKKKIIKQNNQDKRENKEEFFEKHSGRSTKNKNHKK